MDITERCAIHADKMDDEGWYTTANVLDEAAQEIKRLRRPNVRWFAAECAKLAFILVLGYVLWVVTP